MNGRVHAAAAVVTVAVLALWAAACTGGSGPSAGSASPRAAVATRSPSAVAYSACMRSHGVPGYPDPGSDGDVPKTDAQHLGVSTSRYQAAQAACQPLLPVGVSLEDQARQCAMTNQCPPALVRQMLTAMRKFAQCMRARGFPKFPDPAADDAGVPGFAWSVSQTGIDPHSARYEAKEAECRRLGGLGGPRAVSP